MFQFRERHSREVRRGHCLCTEDISRRNPALFSTSQGNAFEEAERTSLCFIHHIRRISLLMVSKNEAQWYTLIEGVRQIPDQQQDLKQGGNQYQ